MMSSWRPEVWFGLLLIGAGSAFVLLVRASAVDLAAAEAAAQRETKMLGYAPTGARCSLPMAAGYADCWVRAEGHAVVHLRCDENRCWIETVRESP